MKNKPIFTSLSPNTEKDDIRLALKLIFHLGKKDCNLEKEFADYFGVEEAFSFNSGRSAFMAILDSLSLEKGDEVLLQAFTCNAAVNPILALGLKPVYVDCDQSFNMDYEDLKKKISARSKVVLVQHTFGQPADLDKILSVSEDLILIEDCAHSLGAKYKGKKVGTFGQAAFFSFSRDKVISSVYGGMVITNDKGLEERIRAFHERCDFPGYCWILQQLLHPVLMNYLVIPLYYFPWLGKIVLNFFQVVGFLSKSVHKKEKKGELPAYFPKKLPKALALLALNQFKKLERFNEHRAKIANLYFTKLKGLVSQKSSEGRVFLKFPVLFAGDVLEKARKKRILLDDGWRKSPVVPLDTDLEKMKYLKGSCPQAEKIADSIVNLPTHINISEENAQRVIDLFL